jgi:hypothetical protein
MAVCDSLRLSVNQQRPQLVSRRVWYRTATSAECGISRVGRISTAVNCLLGPPVGACKHATTMANLRSALYHIGLVTDQGFCPYDCSPDDRKT